MCNSQNRKYGHLGAPDKIWAIAAVHGDVDRLTRLHDYIFERFNPGDKLVYTGNYTGYDERSVSALDEILTFRRLILAQRGVMTDDIVYLRGAQEEIMEKLLQLPFAPNPTDILLWMLGNGLNGTLASYGLSPHDGIEACRAGTMALTKWVSRIRETIRSHAGHDIFFTHLRRAAHCDELSSYPMLFVHAGLDASKTLDDQGDRLWWGGRDFDRIEEPYAPFSKVVRGHDPARKGIRINCVTATIDDGCGFGGSLVGAGFTGNGELEEMLDA